MATIFPTAAPHEWRIDLRTEQPLAPLASFLDEYPGRVLLAADSAGRREVLLEMLRAASLKPAAVGGWHDFVAGNRALRHHGGAGDGRPARHHAADHGARRSAALRTTRAAGTAPAPRQRRSAGHPARSHYPATRLTRGPRGIRCGPLCRPAGHAGGRPGRRVRGARIRRRRQAVRARCSSCTWSRATRARRPKALRCTSWAPTNGPGRASAPPTRSAMSPPSCWTCMRSGRRGADPPCPRESRNTRRSHPAFLSRKPPTRPRPSARSCRTCPPKSPWTAWCAVTWASARPRWPCAPRSSPRRPASRWRCWCRPRCSPSSTPPTSATASPTGRCASSHCHASEPARNRTRCWRASKRARWTSSSPRTACCTPTCASRNSGWSSSMKNIASACATRRS